MNICGVLTVTVVATVLIMLSLSLLLLLLLFFGSLCIFVSCVSLMQDCMVSWMLN